MPTRVIGKNCDFSVTNVTTVADGPFTEATSGMTRIESRGVNATLTLDQNVENAMVYGEDWQHHEIIDGNWSVDLDLWYSTNEAPSIDAILLDLTLMFRKRAFVFWPNGFNATPSPTQPEYSGRVVIANATLGAPRGGLATLRVRLQGDGQLYRAVA